MEQAEKKKAHNAHMDLAVMSFMQPLGESNPSLQNENLSS